MNARQRQLSKYMKRHMKRLEISQTDIAKFTGVTRSYISKLINGKAETTPSVDFLGRLAECFSDSHENAMDAAGVYDRGALELFLDRYPSKASIIRQLVRGDS